MRKKEIIQWVKVLLISTVIAVCAVGAFVVIELKTAKDSGKDAPSFILHNRLFSKMFLDDDYKRLIDALVENDRRNQSFSSVWDFDEGVLLSKQMFNNVDMFGQVKYKYRPNITIHNIRVWTGLRYQSLSFVETAEIKRLLNEVDYYKDVHFKTDGNGFKKTTFSFDASSPAVFFLGDSFTEGLYVKPENTFVNQFGMKLKADGIDVTPVNLGVDGYSALEMSWMLKTFAPIYNPQVVIVNLFPNDVHVDYNQVIRGYGISEANYARMFKYLRFMMDFCRYFDITFVVSAIPPKKQFRELRNFSAFQDHVKAWSKKNGVLFLDPRAYFSSVGADKLYFFWDPHFTPAGHKYYADFLYRKLAPLIEKKLAAFSPDDSND